MENSIAQQPTPGKGGFFIKILIASVCLVIIGGIFLYVAISGKKQQSSSPDTTLPKAQNAFATPTPMSSQAVLSETAQEALTYLQTQKRADGFYNAISHYDSVCKSASCSVPVSNVLPTDTSWTALANYAGYVIFRKPEFKNSAVTDITLFSNYCITNMSSCLLSLSPSAIIYQGLQEQSVLSFLQNAGQSLLSSTANDVSGLSIQSRELALLFEITQNNSYLQKSESDLASAKTLLSQEFSANLPAATTHACWYTLANVEAGVASGKTIYLDEAKKVYTINSIRDAAFKNSLAESVEPCIETYFLIAKATNDTQYREYGMSLLQYFMKNFWDSKSQQLAWGEGGVLAVGHINSSSALPKNEVSVADTAYFVYLLSLANDLYNNSY